MRIFSVDPDDPFLRTLAERVVDGTLWPDGRKPDHPFAMAEVTIYLPTRRAARALAVEFLRAVGASATVLPRIEALGEEEDEEAGAEVLSDLEARVVLATLVRAWASARAADEANVPASGPDAVRLGEALRLLLDQVETQEADWTRLPELVEDIDLAAHWGRTTEFLRIATEAWPEALVQLGKMTPAAARRKRAERAAEPSGPLIIAGSTGSIPATRRLMRRILESPWGVLVLPGLDREADAAAWRTLDEATDRPGHPQFGMAQLLESLSVAPHQVARLRPHSGGADLKARGAVLRSALRPAAATDRWREDRAAIGDLAAALAGVTLLEAPDEPSEAAAIGVAMRGALAKGGTVALVTPDRGLARRVRHVLARWDVEVDDSGGEPLARTPAGVLARLLATVAAGGRAAEWLALLKTPGVTFGLAEDVRFRAVREVERMFRGVRVAPHRVLSRMAAQGEAGAALAQAIGGALHSLTALGAHATVGDRAAALVAAIDACAPALKGADHEALDAVLETLSRGANLVVDPAEWPATFEALIEGMVVRGPPGEGAVRILGPLEARLQSFDHVVLAGLNEGVWPPAPDAGPWMSRGMMASFGIDLPERRIGLAAHDVYIAAHNANVTLSRSKRAASEPTVASRWWQRLIAFAGEAARPALDRGAELLALAALLDEREPVAPAARPEPTPRPDARPREFSFTEVRTLVRDPYAIYAKRILKLRPLEELEADPGARDKGILVHEVLARFIAQEHHQFLDAQDRFARLANEALAQFADAPDARAIWGARLRHIAPAVVAAERMRTHVRGSLTEVEAGAEFEAGVKLHGRIDRIDITTEGYEVIDYKTGAPPTKKAIASFMEPQLPLEVAALEHAALKAVQGRAAAGLAHVIVGRGRDPILWCPLAGDALELAAEAQARLLALVRHYEDEAVGYLSRARVEFESRTDGDYDHLARVGEWQAS